MYTSQNIYKQGQKNSAFPGYHTRFLSHSQEKTRQRRAAAWELFLPEGLAVGALIHGGIHLVGTHQNPIQGAVVLSVAVVSALLDSAFDALVCMTVHINSLLLFEFCASISPLGKFIREIYGNIAFLFVVCYFIV